MLKYFISYSVFVTVRFVLTLLVCREIAMAEIYKPSESDSEPEDPFEPYCLPQPVSEDSSIEAIRALIAADIRETSRLLIESNNSTNIRSLAFMFRECDPDTSEGAKGQWQAAENGKYPQSASPAACNDTSGLSFIARVPQHNNTFLPGILFQKEGCFVISNNELVRMEKYEVLCENFDMMKWVPMTDEMMDLPDKTMVGGQTDTGKKLYIGRINEDKFTYLGIVKEDDIKACHVIHHGTIQIKKDFEILVIEEKKSS